MDILIAVGADVNLPGRLGTTHLIEASAMGEFKCMKSLINAGADVDESFNSMTPLCWVYQPAL